MVFGTKAKILATEKRPNLTCSHCNTTGRMSVSVVGKYFHMIFIPTFPLGKKGYTQCEHCKQTLEEKEMAPAAKSDVNNVKQSAKTPVWMFSGLFVIFGLGLLGSFFDAKNSKEDKELVAAPMVGDKYYMKLDVREYSIFRLNKVTNDSIFFDLNSYSVNKPTGIHKIDKEENYMPGGAMSREQAQQMLEEGKIYDVSRR